MSKKNDLKKQIEDSRNEIEELEKKRNRSQSALLQAFLEHRNPNETETEYFKVYSQLIELERDHLRKLLVELAKIDKK